MRFLTAVTLSLALAAPALAETLSEATGNWAGKSNGGFYFRARLSQNQDKAHLKIWGGALDGVPPASGAPEFDNDQIALTAFATRQELEFHEFGDGGVLQLVTEFADEEAEGQSTVQIQYRDNQYMIVGYYLRSTAYNPGDGAAEYECEVDLQKMRITENGKRRKLAPLASEDLNASDWTWSSAFDRGWCTPT